MSTGGLNDPTAARDDQPTVPTLAELAADPTHANHNTACAQQQDVAHYMMLLNMVLHTMEEATRK